MARRGGWRRVLFIGGVGCLGVVLALAGTLGVALLWAGYSYRSLGDPQPRPAAVAVGPALAAEKTAPGQDAGTPVGSLRLDVHLQEGIFEVRPGPPGTQVTLEGSYAPAYYELVDKRRPAGELGGEIILKLRPKVGLLTRMFAGLMHLSPDDHPNQLTLTIPRDLPVDLKLVIDEGVSRVDLGGLSLTGLDATQRRGSHRLGFPEPLQGQLERMQLVMEMGEAHAEELGNARPQSLDVSTRMGDFTLDMAGAWVPGMLAEVDVSHSMGDLRLLVPRHVHIDAESSSRVIFGGASGGFARRLEDTGDASEAPALRIRARTSMGGITIQRR